MIKFKRLYHHDPAGLKQPVNNGVIVQTLPGEGKKQHFSPTVVQQGQAGQWLTLSDTHLTIHCRERGDLNFKIVRVPGRYCCHCGEKLLDEPAGHAAPGEAARAHVAKEHAGIDSPDANNPAGYSCQNYYETELET